MPYLREVAKAEIAASSGAVRYNRKITFTSSRGRPHRQRRASTTTPRPRARSSRPRRPWPASSARSGSTSTPSRPASSRPGSPRAKEDGAELGIPEQMRQMSVMLIALGRLGRARGHRQRPRVPRLPGLRLRHRRDHPGHRRAARRHGDAAQPRLRRPRRTRPRSPTRSPARRSGEFADAIGDPNPAYRDADGGQGPRPPRRRRPADLPRCCPSGTSRLAHAATPRSGLDYSRVVHGEQRFVYAPAGPRRRRAPGRQQRRGHPGRPAATTC